jgi:hypothetical protein
VFCVDWNKSSVGRSTAQTRLNLQVVQKPKSILEDFTLKVKSFMGMISELHRI